LNPVELGIQFEEYNEPIVLESGNASARRSGTQKWQQQSRSPTRDAKSRARAIVGVWVFGGVQLGFLPSVDDNRVRHIPLSTLLAHPPIHNGPGSISGLARVIDESKR
jgi:hypothetical protein